MDKEKNLISIIVPVYNVENYLRGCVNSILEQTYTNIEIILVEDGSPDGSSSICDEYSSSEERVRVFHQSNQGLSGARNTGIEQAKGDYLIFVDSDDTVEATLVEELYNCLINNACTMAACGRKYIFEDGEIICKVTNEINKVFNFTDAIREMNTFRLFDMSATSKIYNKILFQDIRFPVGKLSEDYFIMYKLIDRAQKVGYTSKPLYNYLQRQNSISRNKKINHDFIEAAKEQMEYLDRKYPELSVVGHTAYASANLTVMDFYIKNQVACPKEKRREFKKKVFENIEYIKVNKELSKEKRTQFYLFLISYRIYKSVFTIYRKLRRV